MTNERCDQSVSSHSPFVLIRAILNFPPQTSSNTAFVDA